MTYRIVTDRNHYLVQYRGWQTLWIWVTHAYGGYGDAVSERFATLERAKAALNDLKRNDALDARPREVVYTEKA
jgi:hypothetical protein